MKTIIISAFMPFGDYLANSSELAVRQLINNTSEDFKIVSIIFPATIPVENRGEKLVGLAHCYNAAGIISLGMASEKKGLCVEHFATNVVSNAKYCPAELQDTPVDKTQNYRSTIAMDLTPWNLEAFFKACSNEQIFTEYSDNAGGFCCNHLAYQARSAILREEQSIPYIFLHIPCCPETVPNQKEFEGSGKETMTVEMISHGLNLLLQNSTL